MARKFGTYSPEVPLGTTWEETFVYKTNGAAVDITGFSARAQLSEEIPARALTIAEPDPVFEITTPGYYLTPPAWPVIEGLSIPTGTDGRLNLVVDAADTWIASPDNEKRKLVWDIRFVDAAGYVLPLIVGKVTFTSARTV